MRSKSDYEKLYFKTVGGSEGSHCNYPTKLDTYGCGCQHDCIAMLKAFWIFAKTGIRDLLRLQM